MGQICPKTSEHGYEPENPSGVQSDHRYTNPELVHAVCIRSDSIFRHRTIFYFDKVDWRRGFGTSLVPKPLATVMEPENILSVKSDRRYTNSELVHAVCRPSDSIFWHRMIFYLDKVERKERFWDKSCPKTSDHGYGTREHIQCQIRSPIHKPRARSRRMHTVRFDFLSPDDFLSRKTLNFHQPSCNFCDKTVTKPRYLNQTCFLRNALDGFRVGCFY